jgi:hypothetical protein
MITAPPAPAIWSLYQPAEIFDDLASCQRRIESLKIKFIGHFIKFDAIPVTLTYNLP